MDYELRTCAIDASVGIRDELLEYLLCLPFGAAHESLFVTHVDAETLNAALLTLGVLPGDERPLGTEGAGADGGGAARRRESLRRHAAHGRRLLPVRGVARGRRALLLPRGGPGPRPLPRPARCSATAGSTSARAWPERGPDKEIVFAAGMEGNLINLAFFSQGYTLVTPVPRGVRRADDLAAERRGSCRRCAGPCPLHPVALSASRRSPSRYSSASRRSRRPRETRDDESRGTTCAASATCTGSSAASTARASWPAEPSPSSSARSPC